MRIIDVETAWIRFEVEGHADEEKQPVDTKGAVLVFISRSVSSSNVASAYNNHSIPVVAAESHIWDDMKCSTDSFVENNVQSIIIVDEDHPIAGGEHLPCFNQRRPGYIRTHHSLGFG